MDINDIEIIDDSNETSVSNTEGISIDQNQEQPKVVENNAVVLETKIDKRKQKKAEKQRMKEEKRRLKLEKKNKKNNINVETPTSSGAQNTEVELVETAITKGSSGSKVIGKINGDVITPTNEILPSPIDITIKPKVDNQKNIKKVKVVTKKEKIISIIIYIFVILGIGAAGYAAYYFGYANNPSIYTVKNINLELGDELPSTVSYYVTSPHSIDDMNYKLDLTRVSKDIPGSYQYSVTHKNVTKTGTISIKDTKPPTITVKDSEKLVFLKDTTVKADDLIESCEDLSECDYKLEYVIDTSNPGDKVIKVIATDKANNTTSVDVTIKVIEIVKTMLCISPESIVQENVSKSRDEYTLSFDSNDYLVRKSAIRRYMYSDYTEYFKFIREHSDDDNYVVDRMTFAYTVNINANTNNLTSFNDLMAYYAENGFVCSQQ